MPRSSLLALWLAAAAAPAAGGELFRLPAFLRLGGEASFALAPPDDGFFNLTDYQHGLLRVARLDLSLEARAGSHAAILAQLRSENLDHPSFYALYLRVRPFAKRSLSLQLGKVPPVFGAFSRRAYGYDNPLVGWPLGYQYLSTVRADAIPVSADELLAVRGRGWLVPYPSGSFPAGPGLPVMSATRWDTGVELRIGSEPVELSAALTQGTLSYPRFRDNNDGKQVAARVAWKPRVGLVVGASGANGPYLDQAILDKLVPQPQGADRQTAVGLDLEYSRGRWLLRSELIGSWWEMPSVLPPSVPSPLRAAAGYLEGRYRVAPGLDVAARLDHLGFSRIAGSDRSDTWDANVTRIEAGASWSPRRHAVLKAIYQYNWRDTSVLGREGFVAGQLTLWF